MDELDYDFLDGRDDTPVVPDLETVVAGLNDEQAAAVTHRDRNLLVVAGPGSGKTRVLTHRVAALIAEGVPPWRLLAMTFTNKAADEMRERLHGLIGSAVADQLWASTFHSFCVRLVRDQHAALNLPKRFTICDADESERMIRTALKESAVILASDPKERDAEARTLAGLYKTAISRAKNDMVAPSDTSDLEAVDDIADRYRWQLNFAGAVDFDDLLLYAEQILGSTSEAGHRWRTRFHEVLVDEYQDTNRVQLRILSHFAAAGVRIVGVGDLDQAIFGFRGAKPEQIATFVKDFSPADVITLDRNYRSTQPILNVCRAVISPNPAPFRASPWTDISAGDPVVCRSHPTDRAEAGWVADTIAGRGLDPAETAILVRTLAQTRVFEQALAERRVGFQVIGGVEFYRRAEVCDVVAWLRAALNPKDWLALERAAATPRRGLGAKSLATIKQRFAVHSDLCAALRDSGLSGKAGASAADMADILDQVRAVAARGPEAAVEFVTEQVGVRAAWSRDRDAEGRFENLDQLRTAAAEFDRIGRTVDGVKVSTLPLADRTDAFCTFAVLNSSVDRGDTAGVQLMSVHAAKGREFDNVFVVGLEEKLFPHARSLDSDEELAEERRLLYVAASRPRKRLWLSWAESRYMFGNQLMQDPSRFLSDLPAEVRLERSPEQHGYSQQRPTWRPKPTPGRVIVRNPPSAARAAAVQPANRPAPYVAPGPRVDAAAVAAGVKVRHAVFGDGVVNSVDGGVVEVRFDDRVRSLALDVAPMTVI